MQKYIEAGTLTQHDVDANKVVDEMAKSAANHNLPPPERIMLAEERQKLTTHVQDLLVAVWSAHLQRTAPANGKYTKETSSNITQHNQPKTQNNNDTNDADHHDQT